MCCKTMSKVHDLPILDAEKDLLRIFKWSVWFLRKGKENGAFPHVRAGPTLPWLPAFIRQAAENETSKEWTVVPLYGATLISLQLARPPAY